MKSKQANRFLRKILGKNKWLFLVIILFSIFSAVISSASVFGEKILIDGISESNIKFAFFAVGILFATFLFSIFTEQASGIFQFKFSTNISEDFNKEIMEKMNRIELHQLENKENLDLIDRMQNIASILSKNTLNRINLLYHFNSLLAMAAIVATIRWYFIGIILVLAIPYYFLIKKQGFEQYRLEAENNTDSRKLTYLFNLLTIRNYAKEIRIFKLVPYLTEKYLKIRDRMWKKEKRLLWKHSLLTAFLTLFKNLALLICFSITCDLILSKETSLGSLLLIVSAAQGMMDSVNQILELLGEQKKQKLYVSDLERFFSLSEEQVGNEKLEGKEIVFDQVSFQYPNTSTWALSSLTLKIKPNEKVAIVGENGSGKSTFIKLLLGIYQPASGRIQIGKKSLRNVLKDFREKTACVFQNFIRYQYRIKENISVGNYGLNNEEFYQSQDYFLGDFIKEMPCGYDTYLGQLEEDAREVSGGEWQKIAISRALFRKDTAFLLLDEPMSALDPLVEANFYTNFKELCKDKTAVIISHRLSATRVCDKIYVFDQGEVIEEGNHDELMKKKGKYYTMFVAQQKLYI